ncbi:MAG: SPOR domain-containing protein [Candidatus Marinimicrobia bacterium]|nr:SPOR domain-containing protein [Candidatus Neomarinimicrobiota bacterium]
MKQVLFYLLATGILMGRGQPSSNPVRNVATRVYFTRVMGTHPLGLNPAMLGYYGKPVTVDLFKGKISERPGGDGNHDNTGNLQRLYAVQIIASRDRQLVERTRKEFNSRFQGIPSVINNVDSIYKLRVGDTADRFSIATLRQSLIEAGYSDAWIVTVQAPLAGLESIPRFTMTVLGGSLDAGNNAVSAQWINRQLYGGLDLRDPGKKDKFLSVFTPEVWNINLMAGMIGLGFTAGNFDVSIFELKVISNMNLPTAILDVLFRGVKFDQARDLLKPNLDLLAVAPVSVHYGRQIASPKLTRTIDRFYAGAGINLLLGLADAHLEAQQLEIATTTDSILIKGRTRRVTNVDSDSRLMAIRGAGLSLDLGFVADINPRLTVGLTGKDLFGILMWPDRTVTEKEFYLQLSSEDLDDIYNYDDSLMDSLRQSFVLMDTSYSTGPDVTIYPSRFILGALYRLSPELTVDAALTHYLRNDYQDGAPPLLSLGLEYVLAPVFPVHIGVGIGGLDGFRWDTAFMLNIGSFQWYLGYGESRGMFNTAKGVNFSTEYRLLF